MPSVSRHAAAARPRPARPFEGLARGAVPLDRLLQPRRDDARGWRETGSDGEHHVDSDFHLRLWVRRDSATLQLESSQSLGPRR